MLRLAVVGGSWDTALLVGPFCAYLSAAASTAGANVGAAQSYLSFDDSQRNATYIVA